MVAQLCRRPKEIGTITIPTQTIILLLGTIRNIQLMRIIPLPLQRKSTHRRFTLVRALCGKKIMPRTEWKKKKKGKKNFGFSTNLASFLTFLYAFSTLASGAPLRNRRMGIYCAVCFVVVPFVFSSKRLHFEFVYAHDVCTKEIYPEWH